MGTPTAIIAGQGALPAALAAALTAKAAPFVIFEMDGHPMDNPGGLPVAPFAVERLAALFDELHARGVGRVVLAGAVARPRLLPGRLDAKTARLLAPVMGELEQGDDGLLRAVIALFENDGFAVVGASDVAPDLLPASGIPSRAQPSSADRKDTARAARIVAALAAADLGQGAVVAQGLCLAVETQPGTDAMLRWVADVAAACRPDPGGAGGVFYKAPKAGQDRRVDLPVIGPATMARAAAAGLAGVVIEAGGVMLLDPVATIAEADARGLFLWVRPPS